MSSSVGSFKKMLRLEFYAFDRSPYEQLKQPNGLEFTGRRCTLSMIIAFPSVPVQRLVIQRNLDEKRSPFSVFYPTEHSLQSVMAIASTKISKRFTTP
jgi:hypothetical protein